MYDSQEGQSSTRANFFDSKKYANNSS